MKNVKRNRLTREEHKEQTRQRLIESARQQVAARGFNAASLRDIAEDAGYTQGAFYSNFDSKEALLLEVLQSHKLREAERLEAIIDSAGDDLDRVLDDLDDWLKQLSMSPEHALISTELQLHAARTAEFGELYWVVMSEQRVLYAKLLRRIFDLSKTPPPAALEDIASGLMALECSATLDNAIGHGGAINTLPLFLRALLHNEKRR